MEDLVTINDQKATTTTLLIADAFEKRHDNVMKAIRNLECSDEFRLLNFEASSYLNDQKKPQPMYQITRDGFSFLAMGFTGKKAAEFKEKFIAAFNAMEQALIEGQGDRRQVDVNHSRTTNAPGGLDIRYTLDLTKLVMKPTKPGLKILSRLTGLEMDDLAEDLDEQQAIASGVNPAVVSFSRELLIEDPGAWVEIEAIHNAYRDYCSALETKHLAVGSFCRDLRQIFPGIIRKRSSQGRRLWGYENIRLLPVT